MTTKADGGVRLDFGNLPLVEAVVRLSLEAPVQLRYAVINQVADELGDEFPTLDEPAQFEVPPGMKLAPAMAPWELMGAVYGGNRHGLVITVQRQMLAARWLRRIGSKAPEYPRFAMLRDMLWRAMDAFAAACKNQLPRVTVVNASYVNFLRVAHTEPVLARYFSDLAQVKATEKAVQIHKAEVSWQEPGAIDLRYNLEPVTARVGDETVEGYQITTAAGSRIDKAGGERVALEAVHGRLQGFFLDLISDHAKKEWQFKEVPLA